MIMRRPLIDGVQALKMDTWIEISKTALLNNYDYFEQLLGPERFAPVLKSNAYGHGFEEVFDIIKCRGPKTLCVNYISEGVKLRSLGFEGRVLVVGPALNEHLEAAYTHRLELVIGNKEILDLWIQRSEKSHIHIKFDTGMSRQGFNPESADSLAKTLDSFKSLVAGVCSHFANVEDVTNHSYAEFQLRQFAIAKKAFQNRDFKAIYHIASSASALLLEHCRFDLCRIGISLYGQWPSQLTKLSYQSLNASIPKLAPILTWKAAITTIRQVKSGSYIGYGCTFKTYHDIKLAVIAAGYYEGYPRLAAKDNSYVIIKGHRCPILGRICMNMLMVDVSEVKKLQVGEYATLLGSDGSEAIQADDLAQWSETINYELLARIHERVPRTVVT